MRLSIVVSVSLAILLSTSASPFAAVLCSKKSGAVVLRDACKKKETAIDPTGLGLQGPKGDTGAQGVPGAQGPGAHWAIVRGDGTIAAQTGGITVTTAGALFKVSMGEDVTNKTIQVSNAAIGADSGLRGPITFAVCGTAPTATDCTTLGSANDNQTIFVATTNTSGANEAHAFHIAVF
jgi:hypothetical protein